MCFDCAGSHEIYVCILGCSRSGSFCGARRLAQSVSLRSTSCFLLSRLLFACCHSHLRNMLFRLTVKSRHAFRARRLAQLRRGFGPRHFTCQFQYQMALVILLSRLLFSCLPKSSTRYVVSAHSEISTCVSTAQARAMSAAQFSGAAFFL